MGKNDPATQMPLSQSGLSLYAQAFDALPLGLVFQDADGKITQANPAALGILGLTFDQMRGLTSVDPRWQTIHEDGSPFPGDTHPAMVALRTGKPVLDVRMGVHNPQRDAITWINVKSYPITDNGGGARSGVFSLFEDITRSLLAQHELNRQEHRLSTLISATPVGVFETDLDGRCTFVNARWSEIAGIPAHAALGDGWIAGLHPEDKEKVFAEWRAAAADERPFRLEYRFRHPDGQTTWVLGQAGKLVGPSGHVEGYVGTITDITERKLAEAELAKYREHLEGLVEQRTAELSVAKQAAEAASDAKTAFLANMSHELRTPLHGVIGMTALAQARASDPAQKENLEGVMRAARHLGVIVNDLLDISRIETRRLALVDEYFELREVIDSPTDISRLAAAEKDLGFTVDLAPELARMPLRGDASRLRQVLLNLTGNAVKFTATGGIKVRVSIAEEGPADALLRFEIADTGIGIAAADQARLFEMFEQVKAEAGGLHHGAGLGLALSRRLAEAMGGAIGLQSIEGQGSTFWFTARVRKVRAHAPPATAVNAHSTSLESLKRAHTGKRLLVVDDNEDNRALLKAQLKSVWKSIDAAADGAEALAMAARCRYDLVLMDMRMPRMDGLEATRRMRQLPGWADVPIIAMTANVYPEDRARCLAAGMNDFIPKAVSAEPPFEMLLKWLAPR